LKLYWFSPMEISDMSNLLYGKLALNILEKISV